MSILNSDMRRPPTVKKTEAPPATSGIRETLSQLEQTGSNGTLAPVLRSGVDPRFVHNNTIDHETGMIQSLGHDDTFDATRKQAFVHALRDNAFRFELTCKQFGVSPHTVYKHKRIDKAFEELLRSAIDDYTNTLEWTSREQALTNPKATLERIFQLRALRPEVYARDQLRDASTSNIVLNISGDLFVAAEQRKKRIESSVDVEAFIPPPDLQIPQQISHSPLEVHSSSELSPENAGPRP